MSSEGSVTSTGSRIRQFGLYRTIDARTNEFLKSSRKRQIRQGCACAAISTAITVTVVVSVILVYEYSINSESNTNKKISLRPKWLGLMNESDPTKIDSKFTKKMNFDRSTLKLLPVLLKALNKNRYLEKIIEDYASSSPPYEITDETENYFKKNIFSDTKNWLKIAPSKIYTLDYKTTPLIYIKPSSQRLDYLSRVRKIRNYERMLNYFDRMINDKVTYSKQNQELKPNFENIENPLKDNTLNGINKTKTKNIYSETLVKKYNTTNNQTNITKNKIISKPLNEKLINTSKLLTKTSNMSKPLTRTTNSTKTALRIIKVNQPKKHNKETEGCKCPSNMGQLLNKLIVGLQELVPQVANGKKSKGTCGNNNMKSKSKKKNKDVQSTVSTAKPIFVSTRRRPKINDTFLESTTSKISRTTTTSLIQPVPRKHTIKVNKDPTLTSSMLIKADTIETTTTERNIVYPKTTTEIEKLVYSSTITNTNIPENLENITLVPNNQYHKYNKSIFANVTIKKQNRYLDNSQDDTTGTDEERTLYLKDTESSIISTSTTIPEIHPYTEDNTLNSQTSTMESVLNYETDDETLDYSVTEPTTTVNVATTETRRTTTELIVPFKYNDPFVESSSSAENLLDSVAIMPNVKRPIIPLFRDMEYEDYFASTSKGIKDLNHFDLHSLESVKNKIMSSKSSSIESSKVKSTMRKVGLKSKTSHYHPVLKNKEVDLINMRKMASLVYNPNPVEEEYKITKKRNSSEKNILIRKSKFIGSLNEITKSKLSAETEVTTAVPHSIDQGTSENIEEDFAEEWVRQPENIEFPRAFNKSAISFNDYETVTPQNDVDKTKIENNIKSASMNSMLPPIRPVYLEVRRNNEWKADEHADYDINLANNIFDLPNI